MIDAAMMFLGFLGGMVVGYALWRPRHHFDDHPLETAWLIQKLREAEHEQRERDR